MEMPFGRLREKCQLVRFDPNGKLQLDSTAHSCAPYESGGIMRQIRTLSLLIGVLAVVLAFFVGYAAGQRQPPTQTVGQSEELAAHDRPL